MRSYAVLSLIIVLAGCSYLPSLKLDKIGRASLAKQDFYIIQEDTPYPEGVISGRAAMNEAIKLGDQQEKSERIPMPSPSEAIEKRLAGHLRASGQELRTVSFKGKTKPGNVIGWLRRQGIDSGAVLDVEMGGWGMEPHPDEGTRYLIWINAQMRLKDIGKNAVLAQHICYSDTSAVPVEEAPTKYKLLKDDGALVKKLFRERTQACTKEFIEKALSGDE